VITVRTGIRPEEVKQAARHVLFVEGNNTECVDPTAMELLFQKRLAVQPLGACFSIRSAADALHPYHPDYYFLIDRDHQSDEFVETCWKAFPDPTTSNLLVWPRREIENYFIIPEYAQKSKYLNVSPNELAEEIRCLCEQRLFMDVCNAVICGIREEFKATWIKLFTNPAGFSNSQEALSTVSSMAEYNAFKSKVNSALTTEEITQRYNSILLVTAVDNRVLVGKQPEDFQRLYSLVMARLNR
jgi:hypothetical protein